MSVWHGDGCIYCTSTVPNKYDNTNTNTYRCRYLPDINICMWDNSYTTCRLFFVVVLLHAYDCYFTEHAWCVREMKREGRGRFWSYVKTSSTWATWTDTELGRASLHGSESQNAGIWQKLSVSVNAKTSFWQYQVIQLEYTYYLTYTDINGHQQGRQWVLPTMFATGQQQTLQRTMTDSFPSVPLEGVRGWWHRSHPSTRPQSSPAPASVAGPACPSVPPRRPARDPWWAGWSWDRPLSGNNTARH